MVRSRSTKVWFSVVEAEVDAMVSSLGGVFLELDLDESRDLVEVSSSQLRMV